MNRALLRRRGVIGRPSGLTGYAGLVLADNPAGYWRLNELAGTTAVGEVGGDGTYIGAPTLGSVSEIDVSPTLNGSSQAVSLPSDPGILVGDFTIEAWVRITNTGQREILSKSDTSWTSNSLPRLWFLERESDRLRFAYRLSNNGSFVGQSSTSTFPLSTWTHVAVIRRGSNLEFWLNGTLNRTATGYTTSTLGGFSALTQVGRFYNGGGSGGGFQAYAAGQIDEPAIYHHALDTIPDHYAAGIAA